MVAYVAVVANGGRHIMVRSQPPAHAEPILVFDMKGLDGPYSAPPFLSAVVETFGIEARLHVDSDERFEPETDMIVLEILDEHVALKQPFKLVEWNSIRNALDTECKLPELGRYVLSFLEQKSACFRGRHSTSWYSIGYWQFIEPRITTALTRAGMIALSEPIQLRFSEISTIYKVEVRYAHSCAQVFNVFYKVVPKGSSELLFTSLMCDLFPRSTGNVLYLDQEVGSFLSSDFGCNLCDLCFGEDDEQLGLCHLNGNQPLVDSAIKQWAAIQRESLQNIEKLRHSGVPVCDISWYQDALKQVSAYVREEHPRPDPDSISTLGREQRFLETVSVLWEQAGIPHTIVHGDLHDENVARSEESHDGFIFYDWDYLCITHPFLDVGADQFGEAFKHNEAYLSCWEDYCNDQVLLRKMAEAATPMHWLRKAREALDRKYFLDNERKVRAAEYFGMFTKSVETVEWFTE